MVSHGYVRLVSDLVQISIGFGNSWIPEMFVNTTNLKLPLVNLNIGVQLCVIFSKNLLQFLV